MRANTSVTDGGAEVEHSSIEESVDGESVAGGSVDGGAGESPRRTFVRVGLTALFIAALGILGGWPLLVMIAAFAVSIIIHEFGHFLVAKRAGMKATEFFIGFGPKIFSFRKGETEYGLKAIPAGAYVRIIGMSNLETVPAEDEERTYRSKPYRWRLATVLAGPMANLFLAFLLLVGFFAATPQRDTNNWSVEAYEVGSTAEAIKLQPGERIVEMNGVDTTNYDALTSEISSSVGENSVFVVEQNDGSTRTAEAVVGWRLGEQSSSVLPPLREGDVVGYVNGRDVGTLGEFAELVGAVPVGESFSVGFARDGGIYEAAIVKPDIDVEDLTSGGFAKGYLGIASEFEAKQLGPLEAIGEAASTVFVMGQSSIAAIGEFFSPSGMLAFGERVVSPGSAAEQPGSVSVIIPPPEGAAGVAPGDENRVLSIVGVMRLGAQAAEADLLQFLLLWVLVNVFLAVVNLIPLLPLDGGHAAVATWEKVRGMIGRTPNYRVNMEKLLPLSYAVIAVFVIVGLSAMWLDITSPIGNPFS